MRTHNLLTFAQLEKNIAEILQPELLLEKYRKENNTKRIAQLEKILTTVSKLTYVSPVVDAIQTRVNVELVDREKDLANINSLIGKIYSDSKDSAKETHLSDDLVTHQFTKAKLLEHQQALLTFDADNIADWFDKKKHLLLDNEFKQAIKALVLETRALTDEEKAYIVTSVLQEIRNEITHEYLLLNPERSTLLVAIKKAMGITLDNEISDADLKSPILGFRNVLTELKTAPPTLEPIKPVESSFNRLFSYFKKPAAPIPASVVTTESAEKKVADVASSSPKL